MALDDDQGHGLLRVFISTTVICKRTSGSRLLKANAVNDRHVVLTVQPLQRYTDADVSCLLFPDEELWSWPGLPPAVFSPCP